MSANSKSAWRISALRSSGIHADPGRATASPPDELEMPGLSEKEAVEKGADLLGEGFVSP